jgi:hypothetical protein
MLYFAAHGCCLAAKPDEIATKAGAAKHKKDCQSTREAGELSASDEQAAFVRQVQSEVCTPRSKRRRDLHI